MTWNGHSIVCIEVDEESEFDDPRSISAIGFLAPKLKVQETGMAWGILKSRENYLCLEIDGKPVNPVPETVNGVKYLRTADALTPEDPLMELPTHEVYKNEARFSAIR